MAAQDWEDTEIVIHKRSEPYSVHVTGVFGEGGLSSECDDSVCDSEVCVRDRLRKKILFYPKKISREAYNMLLADTLNVETFVAWWKSSSVSNDFWVEGENVLARVHVTPKRTFFSPRGWTTDNCEHKEALLETLGSIRSTSGISCKTYRGLVPVHGPWQQDKDDRQYPVLWIGRSLFNRQSMPLRTSASLEEHGSLSPWEQPLRDRRSP